MLLTTGTVAALLWTSASSAGVVRFENADTALVGWRLSGEGIEVELVQRLPIQTRAFFEARGLPLDAANELAAHCVMQTIVRNVHHADSGIAVRVDLSSWTIVINGEMRPVMTKAHWLQRWRKGPMTEAGRVAFRWATFPDAQTFLPGDYNWGMTVLGASPGSVVDLHLAWQSAGTTHDAWIRGIQCAADRD